MIPGTAAQGRQTTPQVQPLLWKPCESLWPRASNRAAPFASPCGAAKNKAYLARALTLPNTSDEEQMLAPINLAALRAADSHSHNQPRPMKLSLSMTNWPL